ncbi:MAG: biotin/lipoyl-containing protein, partial [Solirubrobacterales bacterium]
MQIAMPEMGESVTEGIVLEWHVAEGDTVSEGDTVVEVSTDKVDAEVPAPADGVITKLLVSVDDEVKVGAVLAEMEATGPVDPDSPALAGGGAANGGDAGADGNGSNGNAEAVPAADAPGEAETEPAAQSLTIAMPEMGESVTEGVVLEWHVAEGDSVAEGDTVIEVSTDKVDAEVPAPAAGVITKLLVAVDDEVKVGAALAEMETTSAGTASAAAQAPSAPQAPAAAASSGNGADVRATPVARRMAAANGV